MIGRVSLSFFLIVSMFAPKPQQQQNGDEVVSNTSRQTGVTFLTGVRLQHRHLKVAEGTNWKRVAVLPLQLLRFSKNYFCLCWSMGNCSGYPQVFPSFHQPINPSVLAGFYIEKNSVDFCSLFCKTPTCA